MIKINVNLKSCLANITCLVGILLCSNVIGQEYKSLAGTHHITISSPNNQIHIGETIHMKAISNKGYKNFIWTSEFPGIASVEDGKVTALDEGEVLIIAKAKEDTFEAAYLLSIHSPKKQVKVPVKTTNSLYYNNPAHNMGEPYKNIGIQLYPSDVDQVPEWPEIAAKAGLNTISIHPGGGDDKGIINGTMHWVTSENGARFLENCKRYGLEVEFEIHAIRELLPRELFNQYPTMFRMDETGLRQQRDNFCVHSKQALELLAKNVVEFAKVATPTTGRYYFWIDDGRKLCHPDMGDIYSDSDQALMLENYLLRELRKFDSRATIAHLAYLNTLSPPEKIKPDDGVFLEFAPIKRSYEIGYRNQKEDEFISVPFEANKIKSEGWQYLESNLKVFPAHTAQILEYWIDVSRWSSWERPFKALPLEMINNVLRDDVLFYREFGIPHITSFGNGLDRDYKKNFGFEFLEDYGKGFK